MVVRKLSKGKDNRFAPKPSNKQIGIIPGPKHNFILILIRYRVLVVVVVVVVVLLYRT